MYNRPYYNNETDCWSTNPAYQEILKLDKMLTKAEIPHTLKTLMDGWQICYPGPMGPNCVMDAIEHCYSYGADVDRLEIMGLLSPEEELCDSVLGYLTAENVFDRIYKHHSKPPHTHTGPVLNQQIDEVISDFRKLVEKAKSYGLDIKLTPNSASSLELYFHDDYPDTILVDKYELN